MTQPIYPTTWYWIVQDTNPTTQVWEGASGQFVANSSASYQSWVANGGAGGNRSVTGAADNGSGLIRLTLGGPGGTTGMSTNDAWVIQSVGGTTEANGTSLVTVIDATHIDLQGSSFVHPFTASFGVVGQGSGIDTAANLYSTIDVYNQGLPQVGYKAQTISSGVQFTNPMPGLLDISPNGAALVPLLPVMNLFGSTAIGRVFTIYNNPNTFSNSFTVVYQNGGSIPLVIQPGEFAEFVLADNSTKNGILIVRKSSNFPLISSLGGTGTAIKPTTAQMPVANGANVYIPKTIAQDGAVDISGNLTVKDISSGLMQGFIGGLTTAPNTGFPTLILDIAQGTATSSDTLTMIRLLSSSSKTLGAWAAGTGNGALDTGTVANSTWYHVFVIKRMDTLVTDVLFSTSATAPTLPTNYTKQRRIGSFLTDGSAHIIAFVQDGDVFRWAAPLADVNGVSNPGTAAVTRTLTVPTGVQVFADMGVGAQQTDNASAPLAIYLSDLALPDNAAGFPNMTAGNLVQTTSGGFVVSFMSTRTNTSAQIRTRLQASTANTFFYIATLGWTDRRGAR